jgi:RHS repeat-associated protein
VYRYGFQGQEHEITGSESHYSYEYRFNDVRIGRFLSIDPLAAKYAYNSPYAFSENRVIDGYELEGLEWQAVNK